MKRKESRSSSSSSGSSSNHSSRSRSSSRSSSSGSSHSSRSSKKSRSDRSRSSSSGSSASRSSRSKSRDSSRSSKDSRDSRSVSRDRRHNSRSRSPRRSKSPFNAKANKIYIGKLSRNVNKDHVQEIFCNYGVIKSVELPADFTHLFLSRGFAYVEYEKSEEAEKAIKYMDGGQIDGQVINVSIAHGPRRPAKSFRGGRRQAWRGNDLSPPRHMRRRRSPRRSRSPSYRRPRRSLSRSLSPRKRRAS